MLNKATLFVNSLGKRAAFKKNYNLNSISRLICKDLENVKQVKSSSPRTLHAAGKDMTYVFQFFLSLSYLASCHTRVLPMLDMGVIIPEYYYINRLQIVSNT